MVDSDSGHAIKCHASHVFELHPLLVLVSIPGAGLGYRVVSGGSIQKGEVLMTESSFCAGALRANSADDEVVSQFILRVQNYNHNHSTNGLEKECEKYMYEGALSVAALTTSGSDPDPDMLLSESSQQQGLDDKLYETAWVQKLLDNNVYQCRREPRYASLFVALSRFNHSCDPNAINDASREVATVRAIRNILDGEEVTISYVPVGNDLMSRTAALESFGFSCACHRCSRERACDPAFSTQCEDCGMKVMVDIDSDIDSDSDDDDAASNSGDPFSSVRVAVPCLACGSSSVLQATDAMERHAAIAAANSSLRSTTDDDAPGRCQSLAEAALLVAPFATHPETIQLHRGLVRLLLLQAHRRSKSNWVDRTSTSNNHNIMLEQLREIRRLEQAHGGAKHRDLNFLRCFARLIKQCRVLKGKGCCEDSNSNDGMLLVRKHIETRWRDICLLHFGESDAPATFMADTDDDEVVVQYVPIGCGDERLALFDGDDEIDLSGHEIGDEGVSVLCSNLSAVSPLRMLDLDSNGLSSKGGVTLGLALASGAAPLLTHIDLMVNSIGSLGASSLATAMQTQNCSLLAYLDLHGNDIGDEGCVALGAAFAMGAGARLSHLNLSANGIDDRGCASLGSLFAGYNHASGSGSGSGRMLAHLDLSENVFQSCTSLFDIFNDNVGREAVEASSLEYLDLSWNCIADFEPLLAVFTRTRCCTALASLSLYGNALSDRQCNRELAKLKASGATPMLEYEENKCEAAELACEDEDDELRLQQCLRLLADGETINAPLCAEDIWQEDSGATAKLYTESTSSANGPTSSSSLLQDLVERDGFFVVPRLFSQWCGSGPGNGCHSMDALASAMDRLDLAGWPPVFAFMLDSVWNLISTRLWDEMRLLLGDDCVLEPSVFAWSLKPPVPGNNNDRIGQSFGLPHRDYPASEAMFDDGKTPKLLNVWIPVNDATLENGCMYIVPREFDSNFDRPEDHDHMRSATVVRGAGISKLRFALNGARAVPAQAGSLLSWCGNTIHWGSSCSQYSTSPPRKSIAMTFRRRSVAQLEGAGEPITQDCARTMSSNMRLALIARSLLLYNQWHLLKGTAVPKVIYDVTSL
jgi:hypothetical protein